MNEKNVTKPLMSTKAARVDAVLRHASGPRVLHIGCSGQAGLRSQTSSPYWLHGRLLAKFENLHGLEYDPRNVEHLRAEGIRNVHHGDAQSFDLGKRFDTVVAGEIIEHLPNLSGFLGCCHRHLADDGQLILTTPYAFNALFAVYAWVRYPKTCPNDEHVLWLCPTTLTQLAEREGFRVEHLELVADYRPDLPSRLGRVVGHVGRAAARWLPSRVIANTLVAVLRRVDGSN